MIETEEARLMREAGTRYGRIMADEAIPYISTARTDETAIALLEALAKNVQEMKREWTRELEANGATGGLGEQLAEAWRQAARKAIHARLVEFDEIEKQMRLFFH